MYRIESQYKLHINEALEQGRVRFAGLTFTFNGDLLLSQPLTDNEVASYEGIGDENSKYILRRAQAPFDAIRDLSAGALIIGDTSGNQGEAGTVGNNGGNVPDDANNGAGSQANGPIQANAGAGKQGNDAGNGNTPEPPVPDSGNTEQKPGAGAVEGQASNSQVGNEGNSNTVTREEILGKIATAPYVDLKEFAKQFSISFVGKNTEVLRTELLEAAQKL
jgi:hypothetical protein